MAHLTSPNQSTNPLATIPQRAPDSRLLHVWIVVLLATLFLALGSRANAQNVQYDDKALDSGSRGAARIDPVTRGLSFEIPLGSYPGRAGLNVPVTLSYTSKVWNVEFHGYNGGTNPPSPPMQPFSIVVARYAKHSVAGWTSSIGMPIVDTAPNHQHLFNQSGEPKIGNVCLQECWAVNRILIWMPDGSGHELRASDPPRLVGQDPVPDNFYSVDESRMRYQVSTGTVFMPDGSRYLLNSGQYIDRNGNILTSSGGGSWTDSLGRQITTPLPYNPGTSPPAGDQNVPLPGVGGTSINYVLKWRNLGDVLTTPQSLRYVGNTGCPPETSGPYSPSLFGWDSVTRTCIGNAGVLFNPVVLSQIVLPTGQAYTFTYNVYGEIDKVVMPTGAYEKYQYGLVSPITFTTSVYPQGNRGVSSRIISPSGLAADEAAWTYSGGFGTATIVGPAPESKRTELSFWTDSNGSWGYSPNAARAGKVYDERTYNSSGQMLRRKLTDWTMTGSQTAVLPGTELANRHARPIREVEFVLDTGGSALAKTTTYTYDTTYQFSVGVERSSVRVYDFVNVDQNTAQTIAITSLSSIPNGTLLARTAITYLTSDQNYRNRNFLGLPTSVSLYDSNDVLMSQTTYSYDEASYPLISVGSPPYTGWIDPGTTVRGNVTTAASWLNTSGTFLQAHTQFDQFGNVRKSWDEKQNLTEIDYSSAFAFAYPTQVTSADPDGGGPGVALVTASEYDFSTGRTTATIDANNKRTTMAYNDPLNRIKQIVRASTDTVANVQTTYTYDDANRTITVTTDQSNFDDNLIKNQSVLDGLGRVVEHRQYETPTDYITLKTEYDILSRVHRRSNPYRAGEAIVWTTTEYDWLSRATSITTPDGATIRTAYAGDRVLNTDQIGKQRISRVNALGQLTDVWEVTPADGATEATSFPSHPEVSAGYRTSYQYDALSNLVKVNQGSQQRYFMYDSLKRLIRVRNPEQGTNVSLNLLDPITGNTAWSTGYQYDANSNLSQKTDARGIVSTYGHDALNRNTTIDYSDTTINPDVKWFYDGATNGKGRFWYFYKGGDFSTGSDVDHTAIDSYDALGRPVVQRQLFKLNNTWGPTYQMSRVYNLAGAVRSQTYPSGKTVSYTYDAAGRTASFSGNLGDGTNRSYSSEIIYSSLGGISKEKFDTTTTPLYNKLFYNNRGQLAEIRVGTTYNGPTDTGWQRGAIINHYSSQCWGACTPTSSMTDNNGNLKQQDHFIPDSSGGVQAVFTQAFDYDSLNRLQRVREGSWQQEYVYDRWGNRTIHQTNTYGTGIPKPNFGVNTANNRLTAPAGFSMTYDAAGNLTNDTYTGAGNRTYDAENKMTSAWGGNNQEQLYSYDANGQRTKRTVNGVERWQVYGFGGELLAEYPANGAASAPQKEYGYRNGQLLVTAEPASTPPMNVALASNGATATASSSYSGWGPSGVINGDRKGLFVWQEGAWSTAAAGFPAWLEVQFNGSKTITEIDVVTLQDNYNAPVEPTETMTFSSYGLSGYEVQYWNGSAWLTVSGGSVTGNNKIWRKFSFSPLTTTKIRVLSNAAPDGLSRLTELEAWTGPSPPPRYDLALGATATASTSYPGWGASAVVNGDRKSLNAYSDGAWSSAAANNFPEWVQLDFGVDKTINEIHIFTLQDNWAASTEPTEAMTFTLYGLTGYEVQYWNGSSWLTVPGGSVAGNNKIWRKFTFSPITTRKLRVLTQAAPDGVSRLTEIEAYGPVEATGAGGVNWVVTDHLGTPRMVFDETGSLENMTRHDYLPFGEELFADTSGRSAPQGYSVGDGIRQQFTLKERDVETGLDYFGARYYASTQGRFTSVDPIKLTIARLYDPQRINLYVYCRNDPLKYLDPDGEDLVLANKAAQSSVERVVFTGLKPNERQNVDVKDNKVVLVDPSKIDASKASPAYKYLSQIVTNPRLTVNFYGVEQGQTVNLDGTKISYDDAYTSNGLTTGQAGDSVRDVIIPIGGGPPVEGTIPGQMVTTPDFIQFAHEAYGHALDNDAVLVENEYRASVGHLPRSGADHQVSTTVIATPDLLKTDSTVPATQIQPKKPDLR